MGDAIAECGFGCFIPSKNFLNYHLALIGLASSFLGIMGCVSYNNIADSIKNAAWMGGTINNKFDYLYGLSGYAMKETKLTVYTTVLYSDADQCTQDFCNICQKARKAVLGCLVVGLLFAFFSFVISIKRTFIDTAMWKTWGIVTAFTCFAFGCAAYNTHRPCFLAVERGMEDAVLTYEHELNMNLKWSYGYDFGAKMVLISFVFAIYIATFNLLIPVATSAKEDAK